MPLYNSTRTIPFNPIEKKTLTELQKSTLIKVKEFTNNVINEKLSVWEFFLNKMGQNSSSSTEKSGGKKTFFTLFCLNWGRTDNEKRNKKRKKEDNSRTLIGIAGAIIFTAGAILLARADKSLATIDDETKFMTEFKNDNEFNSSVRADNLQREYCAVMKNARVIRDNLVADVQSRRLKAVGVIAAGALMALGSIFAIVLVAKVGIILAIGVGGKYAYDIFRGDSSDKNKKIAKKIIKVIEKLEIEDVNQAHQAAAAYASWVPSAPTLDELNY